MSNESDEVMFYSSVTDRADDMNNVLFKDKNWTYVVDQTSSAGSFTANQCQFDLSTFGSQAQWVSLQEAIVQFPVRISADVTVANAPTLLNQFTMKNGYHHWIDSAQLIVDGQTIQSAQPYQNVASTFKILSEWSQDELIKYGRSCGVILDDCTGDATISDTDGLNNATSANNLASTGSANPINVGVGFAAYSASIGNKALPARSSMIANLTDADSLTTGPLAQKTLGSAAVKQQGNANAAFSATAAQAANQYLAFYLCTVRLKDIVDLDQFPMTKNLRGYLYLNFNATQSVVTVTGTEAIGSIAVTPLGGRTNPIIMNPLLTGATATSVITVRAEVNGASDRIKGSTGPLMSTARLLLPFYEANPRADAALTMSAKKFSTMEKLVNPIYVGKGASTNVTLTSGVSNPRGLIMLPMWTDIGTLAQPNPELSLTDSVPGTSGIFATLNNLQVYKANKPIYQNPIQYTFDQWVQENSKTGAHGGVADSMASGLLTEQLFNQNHRFYYVDLSRRTESEDGASQSIQVAFQNASFNYSMKVICIVLYEKHWTIDTALCKVNSAV